MANQPKRTNDSSTNSLGIWLALGAGIGAAIGSALEDIAAGVAFGVALGAALGAAFQASRRPKGPPGEEPPRAEPDSPTPPGKPGLFTRFALAMAGFVLATFVSVWLVGLTQVLVLKVIVALLPVIPAIFGFQVIVLAFSSQDELERRILLEALTFSLSGAALVGLMVGLLESAGLQQPNWVWIIPLVALLNIVGQWVARRKYR